MRSRRSLRSPRRVTRTEPPRAPTKESAAPNMTNPNSSTRRVRLLAASVGARGGCFRRPTANPSRRLGHPQMRRETTEAILSHRDQPPQHGAFDHFEVEMIGGTDAAGSTAWRAGSRPIRGRPAACPPRAGDRGPGRAARGRGPRGEVVSPSYGGRSLPADSRSSAPSRRAQSRAPVALEKPAGRAFRPGD